MKTLAEEIQYITTLPITTEAVRRRFLERLNEGNLTRDEGNPSHYSVYFLPYNPDNKTVFIVHHIKSGLWLSPGGHIDEGERLLQTLQREIKEELGFDFEVSTNTEPSLLTLTPVSNPKQPCTEHLDIWYFLPMNDSQFNVDPREFHETRWINVAESRKLITDPPNLEALNKIEKIFDELVSER